ncbi:Fc receptor-like protein 3 isoform X2 [Centroberyx affinis]|uniref:Fc receptor-like protein 3 isoform X2 n=1 Tax=Centroberyx affinis TaxID=166261 RepID=UPI003A5C36EF
MSVFVVIFGASVLGRPELDGPAAALLDHFMNFFCKVQIYPEDESILMLLFKEGDRTKILAEYTSMNGTIAEFPMIARSYHEGYLECEARVQNNSLIQPTISDRHYLKVVEPVQGAEVVVQSGPVEFHGGKTLELRCDVVAGNHISYSWLVNGRPVSPSPLRNATQNQLFIYRTTPQDSGSYMCVATNQLNETQVFTSNSSEVLITVKESVSNPDISFTVLKEATQDYYALVTCQSTRGTPPITFSLYNSTEFVINETVEDRTSAFTIPVVLGRHLGWFQCQADNGDQIAYSPRMPLEVVPVGGPVTMSDHYDIGENFAVIGLRFYCKAAKGSHLRYQWFLNKTLLAGQGTFYRVVHQPPHQSILLLAVGRSSAGTYHCEVSDSFDETTVIRSEKRYFDKEVLNRLPIWVVAVVFGCFIFLVSMVSICCCVGVVFRRRQYGEKSLNDLEMESVVVTHEDELDSEEYREEADVVKAARIDESDQESEASTDEWPQIAEEKTTLEDEPVEEP